MPDARGQLVVEHRRLELDLPARLRRGLEQVALRPDRGRDLGDQLLADAVERGVGDLGEELLEVVVEQPVAVRQHGERRVGAHRADRLLAARGHGGEQDAQVLVGVAEGELAVEHGVVVRLRHARGVGQGLHGPAVGLEPLPVGMLHGERALELLVVDDAPLRGVHEEDPPGVQALLDEHALRRDVEHADLGGHDHEAVLGHVVAGRPKPVPVEDGADHGAVGERDGGRPVPRLHQAAVVLVEGLPLLGHRLVARPRLGDHHEHGQGQGTPGHHEELEHVVERRGVAAPLDDDGEDLLEGGAEQAGATQGLARVHPVDVPAERVDLAVVGDVAVRVRERPRRERVGGEPLVDEGQRRLHQGVGHVGEHGLDLVGREHALVDERVRRQARHVEVLAVVEPRARHRVLRALADHVEDALERRPVGHAGGAPDEHLAHPRLDGPRRGAHRVVVGGHVPPAQDRLPLLGHHAGEDLLARLRLLRIAGKEDQPGPVVPGRGKGEAQAPRLALEEGVRHLDEDAGAVAGVDLAAAGPAVEQVLQHGEGLAHDGVRLPPLHVHDEAHAARVVLVPWIVQALRRRQPWCRQCFSSLTFHATRSRSDLAHRALRGLTRYRVHLSHLPPAVAIRPRGPTARFRGLTRYRVHLSLQVPRDYTTEKH